MFDDLVCESGRVLFFELPCPGWTAPRSRASTTPRSRVRFWC
ncbi:lysophospholipase domain protein [Mycobacterium ulcerans str. Harvey]|uniref:Lysophospholipase domain protein n=1 Tax=Mycobacterium ulcerans str. Harvey TaxID=1299332 RepID=A0ABP3AH40_MYCUL|nr:lysophospholipase domain protein [Mycobacterium ulcerans str. Harvey]